MVPATPAAPPPPAEYNLKLAPFWVPVKTPANEDRFLVATFVLNTKDAVLNTEMQDKLTTLRDSIYYYLSNKDYAFLTDPASAESIREDLIEAINHYLVQGELKNLYFDQFCNSNEPNSAREAAWSPPSFPFSMPSNRACPHGHTG